jgi:starch synthase (maltosyl-transferring)
MLPLVNDRWTATFRVAELGRYGFKVQGWVDHFETWHRDLLKRIKAETDAPVDYLIGADLIDCCRRTGHGADAAWLRERGQIRCVPAKMPKDLRIQATDPMLHEIGAPLP